MSTEYPRTIVLAGGGSGGHLFPGIAVAAALRARGLNLRFLFVGSTRDVESRIVRSQGFDHLALPVEPSSSAWNSPVRFANRMWRSARGAKEVLLGCKPSVVIGLGGYASVPVVWAARLARIPLLLLEQNVVPGRATSWLCGRASLTCLGFADAARRLPRNTPCEVTGNPVRAEVAALSAEPIAGIASRRELLVLGGSQGSIALNDAFLSCIERSCERFEDWSIVHQAGQRDADRVASRYQALGIDAVVEPFFEDLPAHYRRAGLAISRAGALSLSELACAGVPAVLIPYRKAVRNHQRLNAYAFEHVGAARVVRQSRHMQTTIERLDDQLAVLLADDAVRGRMARAMRSLGKPNAAELVADHACRLLNRDAPALGWSSSHSGALSTQESESIGDSDAAVERAQQPNRTD